MVRPERFELPTPCFVGKCSIQLSYGRTETAMGGQTRRWLFLLDFARLRAACQRSNGTLQAPPRALRPCRAVSGASPVAPRDHQLRQGVPGSCISSGLVVACAQTWRASARDGIFPRMDRQFGQDPHGNAKAKGRRQEASAVYHKGWGRMSQQVDGELVPPIHPPGWQGMIAARRYSCGPGRVFL